jgi:hypothetical protein
LIFGSVSEVSPHDHFVVSGPVVRRVWWSNHFMVAGGKTERERERERERREETNALHRHALSDLFSPRRSCLLMAHSSD